MDKPLAIENKGKIGLFSHEVFKELKYEIKDTNQNKFSDLKKKNNQEIIN